MAHLGTLTNRSGHCDDSKQVNENSLQDACPDPALAGDPFLGGFRCPPGLPWSSWLKRAISHLQVLGDRGYFILSLPFQHESSASSQVSLPSGALSWLGENRPGPMTANLSCWVVHGIMALRVSFVVDKVGWPFPPAEVLYHLAGAQQMVAAISLCVCLA